MKQAGTWGVGEGHIMRNKGRAQKHSKDVCVRACLTVNIIEGGDWGRGVRCDDAVDDIPPLLGHVGVEPVDFEEKHQGRQTVGGRHLAPSAQMEHTRTHKKYQ